MSGILKLKTRGVLYPSHTGRSDEPLSVQVAITKLELSFVLAKVKSKFGVPIWEIQSA
jgi:hypothetical protein